jgi:hypothetical protein
MNFATYEHGEEIGRECSCLEMAELLRRVCMYTMKLVNCSDQ